MSDKKKDADIFDVDWGLLSKVERDDVIDYHMHYVNLTKKAVGASGSYISNIRSLMLMLFVSLVLVLQHVESRTIVLTIISLQFIKAFLSKLIEANLFAAVSIAKRDLQDFLYEKLKKEIDA